MQWWRQETPVGEMTVVAGDAGLRRIQLNGSNPPEGDFERDEKIAAELDEYFGGRRRHFTVPVDLGSVPATFRRRVLETLSRDVPYGETVSYGELAVMAARPGAARAVGSAMANNPVPIVVPCHRVLATGGRIGGYGGGLGMKRALLALEGVELA
ncbi:MAG: methylated-DNA--[protein]-cysteine S-methyltransferase [Actinomycetota bacterium]